MFSPNLSHLSNVLNKNVVKKAVYKELVANVTAIATKLPSKSDKQFSSDKRIKKKIDIVNKSAPNTDALVGKYAFNTKV